MVNKPFYWLSLLEAPNSYIDDEQLVWLLDGYDVLFTAGATAQHVRHLFHKLTGGDPDGVVFNSECNCWPGTHHHCERMRQQYEGPNPYLNSGALLGRARSLKKLLRVAVDFACASKRARC